MLFWEEQWNQYKHVKGQLGSLKSRTKGKIQSDKNKHNQVSFSPVRLAEIKKPTYTQC